MSFIDFTELKDKVSFSETIAHLDLELKRAGNQWRGACPACQSGGDRALVITEGKGFFCFAEKKGGDQIALAAHILGIGTKEAAQALATSAGIVPVPGTSTSPGKDGAVPESEGVGSKQLQPLSYLEPDHDAVVAIGFDPEVAKSLGLGYAPRGMLRGTVAVPIRDAHGVLKGYIGIEDAKLPADFQTNVVPFKKTA